MCLWTCMCVGVVNVLNKLFETENHDFGYLSAAKLVILGMFLLYLHYVFGGGFVIII